MTLFIKNQSGVTKSYLSGSITVAPGGTTQVLSQYQVAISTDGQLIQDLLRGLVYLTDGVNVYSANDAVALLRRLPQYSVTDVGNQKALDVNVVSDIEVVQGDVGETLNVYEEVSSVASSSLTTIVTYIVPISKTAYLVKSSFSGTNIATYQIKINSAVCDKRRTFFGNSLNGEFSFNGNGTRGIPLRAEDVVTVTVVHSRPFLGDFNARIQVMEI